jgi:hypothetical protein
MDDLIDMIVADQSPADISDKIKEILMQKSAENIDTLRPVVAASIFGSQDPEEIDQESEVESDSDESYEDEDEDFEETEE